MTKSIYLTATGTPNGTLAAMANVIEGVKNFEPNVGIFRAFTSDDVENDSSFRELLARIGCENDLDQAWGTTVYEYNQDPDAALDTIESRYTEFAKDRDVVIILGNLEGDAFFPGEHDRSVQTALSLESPIVPIISGKERSVEDITTITEMFCDDFSHAHACVPAIIVADGPSGVGTYVPDSDDHAAILAVSIDSPRFEQEDMHVIEHALTYEHHVVTPRKFTRSLVERARSNRQRIVLPESDDDRILRATQEVLSAGIADVILLGDTDMIKQQASAIHVDISGAEIVDPQEPETLEKYAQEYARLRAKKGVTIEQARDKVKDISFYATMMVHMGDADGMVSGANHTTAHTIVPSFQIIKAKPGTATVSSCFIMLMADRVYVYGDCAVTTNPSPQDLASIAISSAETAQTFGIEPRIAMLSYSTGTSGKGPSVDAVVEATRIARDMRPDLLIEGPIQYDAAVDASVAATKMPNSDVAGKANVFIFPDLNAGNIGYKAVQRSSGAVAVGPVLQGLNKPVNDLSRGALVEDIVNTVAITAIQAQETSNK